MVMPIDPRVRIRPDHEKPGNVVIPRVISVDYARRARVWKSKQLWDAGRLDANEIIIYEGNPTQPVIDGWIVVAVMGLYWTEETWEVLLHLESKRVQLRTASWGRNPGQVEEVDLSEVRLIGEYGGDG